MAPFYQFGFFGEGTSLVFAFVIGIGFGFFLERAGFGSSTKLAAQFYGRDLTVFKVMFTAIITAVLGLFWLAWTDILDLSRVNVLPTYFLPQLVGGLIFGIGFVMGGYCPGTCAVAAATGKMDAWVHLFGMMAGILLFGELFPAIEAFYNSSAMGQVSLDTLLGIPYGTAVFLVVVLAFAGFYVAEIVETRHAPVNHVS
jgi:uncharacterized membrane protein YedE/YeeE